MAKKSNRVLWAQKVMGKLPDSKDNVHSGFIQRKAFDGIILGIDPSLRGTGLALLECKPGRTALLHQSKTLRLQSSLSMPECLGEIHKAVDAMLNGAEVRHVAIEQTIYVQNFQVAQILGAARGAALSAAAIRNIPIFEYPPLRVKQAVVGFGRASKEQMIRLVMQHLNHANPLPSDEADAVSIALCHAFTWQS